MKITTENLTKTYKTGEDTIYALKDCNITIEEGEQLAIMGPSGSGKTTLLSLIGGIIKHSEGKVIFSDGDRATDITTLSESALAKFRRRNIGFVFQDYSLIPEMTARQNITLPLLLDNKKVDKKRFEELCERLMIKDRLNHLPEELSGGQKQRVAIARALITNPSVILCDEPTGNLDSKSGEEVITLLKELCEAENKTLIIVTHDKGISEKLFRTIEIYDGEVTK
ncbi:MAG: ABC transporter ATP-binding protein [Ruminiclostridium sp.]|nr:ABC transporter ATP-binding protein [Ruminiclostridium sp.]